MADEILPYNQLIPTLPVENFVPPVAPAEINLVDVRGEAGERKIETQDPQAFFESLVFDESNACENIFDLNEALHGHSQLRDRITCTPNYPDSLFICGAKKIFEFNRESKKFRVLYEAPAREGYYLLTAIKAYKNYIFFGAMEGEIFRLTLGSLTVASIPAPAQNQYEMINGFSFYEFEGKSYAVVALNSWSLAIKKTVSEIPVPHPDYKTCAGGVSVSPSNRFMVAIGDKTEIYVYELIPNGNKCTYKIRKSFGVLGNCHTADWSPDESCFAVSCEHGECYLFSFKVLPNNDLDIQLSATYDVKLAPDVNGEYPWGRGAIENVKFIPHPDLKLMAFAAANIGQIVIVDYNTFQIVQTFDLKKGGDRWWNLGVDFSSDGKTLFVLFSLTDPWNQISHLNKLLALKLKGVSTLTELCFKHIRKNKEYWGEFDLHTLPETLYEKLSLNNN